ncbi:beta-1-syntrophin isoform X3, partial [Vespula maculifrons]
MSQTPIKNPKKEKNSNNMCVILKIVKDLGLAIKFRRKNVCIYTKIHNSRYPFFFVIVKYLREVTPYFRKASIIQEVGWELQRGFLSATPPPPKSPPRADTRYLPLQLCRLTRAHPSSDPAVEIQSDKDANSTDTVSPLGLPTGLTPCIIPEQLHQSGTHEEPSIQTIHHRHQVTANVITYYQHNEISTASFSTIATLTLSKGRLRFDFGFGFGFGFGFSFSFAFLEEIRLEFVTKAFIFHDLTDDPADPFRDARKPFECSLVQTPVAT